MINYIASQRLGLWSFLCNLFLLQGVCSPPIGTNSPLWSLSMEFWYYILFPAAWLCLVACYRRDWSGIYRWHTLLLVGLIMLLPLEFFAYLVIWLLGVDVATFDLPFRGALLWAAVMLAALLNLRFRFGSDYVQWHPTENV